MGSVRLPSASRRSARSAGVARDGPTLWMGIRCGFPEKRNRWMFTIEAGGGGGDLLRGISLLFLQSQYLLLHFHLSVH